MIVTSVIVLLATVVIIGHLILYIKRKQYSSFKHEPLSPALWWIPGHSFLIRKKKYLNYDDPNEPYFEIRTAFDVMSKDLNSDTIVIFFFHKNIVYTTNVKMASVILSSSKNIFKPENRNIEEPNGIPVFGRRGIVTEPGTEVWSHKRKTMDPAFQKKFLKSLVGEMTSLAIRLRNHLEHMSEISSKIEIYDVFMKAAMEVVCRCGFNLENEIIEAKDSPLNQAVADVFSCLQEAANAFIFYHLPWAFRDGKRLLKQQTDYLHGVMTKHLEQRLQSIENGTDDTHDILSYIIRGLLYVCI